MTDYTISSKGHPIAENVHLVAMLSLNDLWKESNAPALNSCAHLLSVHDATFAVHNKRQTGCLFSITVPGKFV